MCVPTYYGLLGCRYSATLHFRAVNRATGRTLRFSNCTANPAFEFGTEEERTEFRRAMAADIAASNGWRPEDTEITGDGAPPDAQARAPPNYRGTLRFLARNRATGQGAEFETSTNDPGFEYGTEAERALFVQELTEQFSAENAWRAEDTEIVAAGTPTSRNGAATNRENSSSSSRNRKDEEEAAVVAQLVDMGFSRSCAALARAATGDGDAAACANWLLANPAAAATAVDDDTGDSSRHSSSSSSSSSSTGDGNGGGSGSGNGTRGGDNDDRSAAVPSASSGGLDAWAHQEQICPSPPAPAHSVDGSDAGDVDGGDGGDESDDGSGAAEAQALALALEWSMREEEDGGSDCNRGTNPATNNNNNNNDDDDDDDDDDDKISSKRHGTSESGGAVTNGGEQGVPD